MGVRITRVQWLTLLAGHLGWLLDGFDVMLYAFALLTIRTEFGLNGAQAGSLASVTLLASSFGGAVAGFLADRVGRVRVLVYSILVYSLATGLTATAHSLGAFLFFRTLVGIGLGAEWSAGSVLVSETWPASHRGKAAGLMQSGWALGYIAAALLSGWVLPRHGWRVLFVLGAAPALVTLWIRRKVPEPKIWLETRSHSTFSELFESRHLGRVAIASTLSASVLFAYWGLFTWVPAYLALPAAQGGAGLSLTKSVSWIVVMQLGAFAGYLSFGFLADRFGRRRTFAVFVLAAAALVLVYGLGTRDQTLLLVLSPLLGFFGHGYFSVFGALLSELFPTRIRATAQGFCYNSGRALSALAPLALGALVDRGGAGLALASTSAVFALGGVLIFAVPETQGDALK
jgi:MFS family permease